MKQGFAFLLALVLGAGTVHAADKYSMEDLNALAKSEGWVELLEHGSDIAPSKRDAQWEALIEKAANGVIAAGDASAWTTDTLKKRYPFLVKSKNFASGASKIDTKELAQCFQGYAVDTCLERAKLSAKNGDGANALAVAKVASLGMNRQHTACLFQTAVEKNAPGACEDEDLRLAVVAALGLPEGENVKAAQMLTDKCWNGVKAAVNDQFSGENKDSYFTKNACPVLKKKGELKGLRAKRCA